MAGGVDFDLANLIWTWRQKHSGEEGENWFEHIDEILSEYEYKTIDFSGVLQDRVLTSYALVKKPTK
jgi:hypothetical protein